ncbi:MAG: hypothetical protein WC346_15410 [Methanogenium sp.]|jgi:very-short-patch-repair endonuclease
MKRLDIGFIRKSFEDSGYLLLTDNYVNAHQLLEYKCPNGHIHRTRWLDWRKGNRCPYCSNMAKKEIEEISNIFKSEGYILLSDHYKNAHSNLEYICPNGHKNSISWSSWRRGSRCSICAGKKKFSTAQVDTMFKSDGYKLLTTEYNNAHQLLTTICPNGHTYLTALQNWHNGYRCPRCTNIGSSYQELSILNFIKSTYSEKIIDRSRTIIPPYELDFVIPEKKLAIEYCGIYWHSELMGKDKSYHLNKLNLCTEKGYRLITIFEDELLDRPKVVFSRISNALGINKSEKIYARQCEVREISSSTASDFCNKHHLQGYTGSKIKLGLFYKNKIVSVMTFSKLSISKGSKNKEGSWELSRFCSDIHYRVIGGASKLLSYFEKNYQWNEIISYADRRWSSGNLYEKIGFTLVGETKPNYWYFKKSEYKRIHRFALRKNSTDPKDQTEWEIRKSQGWNRIWDCGNLKCIKYG